MISDRKSSLTSCRARLSQIHFKYENVYSNGRWWFNKTRSRNDLFESFQFKVFLKFRWRLCQLYVDKWWVILEQNDEMWKVIIKGRIIFSPAALHTSDRMMCCVVCIGVDFVIGCHISFPYFGTPASFYWNLPGTLSSTPRLHLKRISRC